MSESPTNVQLQPAVHEQVDRLRKMLKVKLGRNVTFNETIMLMIDHVMPDGTSEAAADRLLRRKSR